MNSMISIFLTSNGIDPFYVKAGILALILILFLILLIMQIRLMGKFKKLYRTYDRFMRGKDMESMEETVLAQFERRWKNPMKKKTDRLSPFLKTCSMYIRKPDW